MPTTNTATSEIFIHRHCMQQLLHEAISNGKKPCGGLLTGSGNIVTNCFSVTQKLAMPSCPTSNIKTAGSLCGVYIATDNNGAVNQTQLTTLQHRCQQLQNKSPDYYLILCLDHKGRIDAFMYSDATCETAITLNMQEAQ